VVRLSVLLVERWAWLVVNGRLANQGNRHTATDAREKEDRYRRIRLSEKSGVSQDGASWSISSLRKNLQRASSGMARQAVQSMSLPGNATFVNGQSA
jgi:hypothetical protein